MSVFNVKVGFAGSSGGGSDPGGGTDPTPVNPITVTLTSPDDQSTVAVTNPTFVVGVDTSLEDPQADFTVHLQYSASQSMANPIELTADFEGVDAGVFVTPVAAVPATTWWRARVAQGTTWRSAWTTPQSFTVSSTVSPSSTPITWTVQSPGGSRDIHVWSIYPATASPGDTVTVYGQAFNDTGKILLGGTPVVVREWNFIAQQGNPDDTRHITGTDITPEHWEAVITVPGISPPGAALEVTN